MDVFASLAEGDAKPLAKELETKLVNRSFHNTRIVSDWYESTLRLFCATYITDYMPGDWVLEEEKASDDMRNRGDILITDSNERKILFELKYVQCKNVVFPDYETAEWYERIEKGYHTAAHRRDLLSLEIITRHSEEPMSVRQWLDIEECTKTKKRPHGKFRATCDALEADEAFFMVGIGPRIFTCTPDDLQ